jgi:hypothetical protein
MKIKCDSHDDLMVTIAALVERGIQFEATTYNLTITLSGGY